MADALALLRHTLGIAATGWRRLRQTQTVALPNLRCQGSESDHPLPSPGHQASQLPASASGSRACGGAGRPRRIQDHRWQHGEDPTAAILRLDRSITRLRCWAFPACPGRRWWRPWRPAARFAVFARRCASSGAATSPLLYPDTALNAKYVDYVVRGQGEDTLLELIDALRGKRDARFDTGDFLQGQFRLSSPQSRAADERSGRISLVSFSSPSGREVSAALFLRQAHGRPSCQHRLPFQLQLLRCPCRLRTSENGWSPRADGGDSELSGGTKYGADSVQFYDMNFFLREDHARELADRLAPLNLRWWCEARVDMMSRYSDATLEAIKTRRLRDDFLRSGVGLRLGAARRCKKGITTEETLQMARRTRQVRHHSGVLIRDRQPRRSRARYARDGEIYSQDQANEPRLRNHHAALHARAPAGTDVWRCRRPDHIPD